MKKMKIAAAAVVLVMLASAMIVGINATQYDADGDGNTNTPPSTPEYTVDLSGNYPVNVVLKSNINYYYQISSNVSVKWAAAIDNPPTEPNYIEPDESGNIAVGSLTIKGDIAGTTHDEKKLTMTITKGTGTIPGAIYVKATVSVEINDKNVSMNPISYKININGTEKSCNLTATFVDGVNSTQTISVENGDITTDELANYVFYAHSLPNGLSMTSDGKISGIVKKTDTMYNGNFKSYGVHMEHKETKDVVTAFVKIIVNDMKFDYKVYNGNINETSSSVELPKLADKYYVKQGNTFSVQLDNNNSVTANYVSAINLTNGVNTLIGINNNTAVVENCTNGTGTYRIYVGYAPVNDSTNVNGSKNLSEIYAYFDICVIGNTVGVGSDIIVGSR